ncbi:MAG: Nif11-like leader peptide family natural product precursor [Nostocaceae cyanobacterium]|nr:Nif11-like leader peptide family natural product precursor [Nostocaceae cyanobacterium]
MSLEQVNAFYEHLTADAALYEQYFHKCGTQGCFGELHWDKTKVVYFAATIGYNFTPDELHQVWFGSEDDSNREELLSSRRTY